MAGMASADADRLRDAAWQARLRQTHLLPSIRLPRREAREIGKGRAEEGLLAMGGWFWGAPRPFVTARLPQACATQRAHPMPKPWPQRCSHAMVPSWPAIGIAAIPAFPAFLPQIPGLGDFLKGEAGMWLGHPL